MIRISKPEINIREKLGEVKLESGHAGRRILASETVDEQFAVSGMGRKNILDNGAMEVAQRGTTSSIDNTVGAVDRWFKYASGDTATYGQANDTTVGKHLYFNTNASGYGNIRQKLEGMFVPEGGLDVTLSFLMRVDHGTSPLRIESWNLTDNTQIYSNYYEEVITSDWKKYIISFRLNADDSMDNWHIMLGSNNSPANTRFRITQVQLEKGGVATPFEYRPYHEELHRCMRFYESLATTGENDANRYNGIAWATNNMNVFIPFRVTKSSSPTVSITNNGEVFTGSWQSADGHAVTGTGVRGCTISIQKSNAYTIKYGYFIRNQTINASIGTGSGAW